MVQTQEKLVLAHDFGHPFVPLELHRSVELFFGEAIEAIDAEIDPVRDPADRGFMPGDFALASLHDPFEDP